MVRRLRWVLFRAAQRLLTVASFARRTPEGDAPASPAELESLREGIVGSWVWLGSIDARGAVETARLAERTTVLTFGADGSMLHDSYAGSRLVERRRDTYRHEGRNVVTTHPAFPRLRADAWSRTELRFFWYRLSTTVVLGRVDGPLEEEDEADALVKRTSWRPVPLRGDA